MTQVKVCQFLRVSTFSQSTSRQQEELNTLCVKNNWDVVRTIEEIGSGAKKNKDRESIYELLALADSGRINKVVVHEMSRLGRTTAQSLQLIEKLSEKQVSVYEYQRNIETLNDDGTPNLVSELILSVLASVSRMERGELVSRIKSGMRSAAAAGKTLGRPKGVKQTDSDILKKYPSLVRSFTNGEYMSLRKRAFLYSVSVNTVRKIEKIIRVIK